MKLTRLAGALALALLPCAPVMAADLNVGRAALLPAGFAPGSAIYCPDANGAIGPCTFWPAVQPVSGTLGVSNTDFGALCDVVTGDQAFTVGTAHRCTMTATGRIKMGLSSAALIGAAIAGYTDLFGFKDPSGNQQPGTVDAAGNINTVQPQPSSAGYVQLALVANTRAQLATAITGRNGVVCAASANNTADVLVGGSTVTTAEDGTGNGFPITPGGAWSEGLSTTAGTWFISTAAAVLFCHGN